jgi:hypothetical protein
MTDRADSERSMNLARWWFTEGWAGNVELADDLFSEHVRTNGVLVGVAGPKRRIQERLAGFPDLTTTIEGMFSAHDKLVRGLFGAEHIPAHMGASRLRASRWRSETLLFGVSKTARWWESRRYRISLGF